MSKNITIARLNTLVTANAVQFDKEMGRAKDRAKHHGKGINEALSKIGEALEVAAVIEFSRSVVELGSHIVDLAAQADLSAQTFQTIAILAMDSGVAMEDVAKASENLRSGLQSASEDGADPLNKSLAKINLTAAGLKALSPEEQWQVIAQRVHEATDKQEAYNVVSDLFGKKLGPKLRSTLEELAEGFAEAKAKTQDLLITDEQLKMLHAFGDRVEHLTVRMKVLAVQLVDTHTGFQKMWETLSGSPSSMVDNGPNLLPGRTSKMNEMNKAFEQFVPSNKPKTDNSIEGRMKAAQDAADKKDPFKSLKQDEETKKGVDSLLHLFFDSIDESSKLNRPRIAEDRGMNLAQTDSFARIGLLTGQVANPEQKKQTDLLHQMNETLSHINSGIRRQQADAAYTN